MSDAAIEKEAMLCEQGERQQQAEHSSLFSSPTPVRSGIALSAHVVDDREISGKKDGDERAVVTAVHVQEIVEQRLPPPSRAPRKSKLRFTLLCLLFVVAIALIAVAAAFVVGKYVGDTSPTVSPTPSNPQVSSAAPTSERRLRILERLKSVSSTEDLETVGSSQNRAMHWIVDVDVLRREPDDPRLLQRYILAVTFYATNGEVWPCIARNSLYKCPISAIRDPEFLMETDECSWYGVTCESVDGMDLVSELSLRGDNRDILLSGTIPSEIGSLPMLAGLLLPFNDITGTIPTEIISNSPRLESLFLSATKLRGPFPAEAMRDHPNLNSIVVASNTFGGTFPTSMGTIKKLKIVDFGGCGMSGTIPTSLGMLSGLTRLQIDDNALTGSLPAELSHLEELRIFSVSKNRLNGTVPEAFYGAWPQLEKLELNGNAFSGTIAGNLNGTIRWGSDNPRTKLIFLSDNNFSGTVSPSFASIQPMHTLTLHGNNLEGTMPSEICSKTVEEGEESRGSFYLLQNLTADCQEDVTSGKDAKVHCDCCAFCN